MTPRPLSGEKGAKNYSPPRGVSAKRLDSTGIRFVTSNLVFLEVVTVLSQRRSRTVAVEVGEYLSSHLKVIHVDEALHKDGWHIFQAIPAKNISFVDCSILAVMQAENIHNLLTLDATDFRKLQRQFRFEVFQTE